MVAIVVSERKSKIGRRRAPWPCFLAQVHAFSPQGARDRRCQRNRHWSTRLLPCCHLDYGLWGDVIYERNHRISSILRDFNHRFWGESVIFDAWHPPKKWVKQGLNRTNGWLSPLEVRPGELLAPCGALKEWLFGGAEASFEKWPIPMWGWIIKLAAYFLGGWTWIYMNIE